jgi:peroxidase
MPRFVASVLVVLALCAASSSSAARGSAEWRSLDGSGNNREHPDWGKAGTAYVRVAPANYADGITTMVGGPSPRYVSNRIFNDVGQNIFSENDVSQWGWLWGQFLDHTFGLRDETPAENTPLRFDAHDPLERFTDDLGAIDFARTPAAPGTGVTTPRQQINTVSSYIDAFAVYGGTAARLEWLRDGPIDGTLFDNEASLLLPGNYLPRADARGDVASAPAMDLMGPLTGRPGDAVVAGDVRANENIALTAVHTLFAREHNRIVSLLPARLPEDLKFQIARRVVGAEEQYVTYHEFLPAMGVHLPRYNGYNPDVNASIANEFASVGYRAHSMIHGEVEPEASKAAYSPEQLASFKAEGIQVEQDGSNVKLVIPLDLTFGNPSLLPAVGLGRLLKGLADEREYKNDEQIDDSLRSILFQVPKPTTRDASVCGEPVVNPGCFSDVADLGAVDVQRGRDHGMPSYNALRRAYGLAPKRSYAAITGEPTARFPIGLLRKERRPIDDPHILDFTKLEDADGKLIRPGTDAAKDDVVSARRRTTLAARLKAIYGAGNVGEVDAFVGMLAEPHVRGTEFGPLQLAIWKKQFQALRDGDRFFYANDPLLRTIRRFYGIDYRQTLSRLIQVNTGTTVQANVFKAPLAP